MSLSISQKLLKLKNYKESWENDNKSYIAKTMMAVGGLLMISMAFSDFSQVDEFHDAVVGCYFLMIGISIIVLQLGIGQSYFKFSTFNWGRSVLCLFLASLRVYSIAMYYFIGCALIFSLIWLFDHQQDL